MQVIFALSSCSFWLCIALILGTRKHAHTLLHLHPHINTYTRTHRQRNSCWGSHTHRVKCKFLSSDLFLVRVFRAPISGSPLPTNAHATPFPPPLTPCIFPHKSKIALEHYGRAKQRLRYAWGTGVSHVFSLFSLYKFLFRYAGIFSIAMQTLVNWWYNSLQNSWRKLRGGVQNWPELMDSKYWNNRIEINNTNSPRSTN